MSSYRGSLERLKAAQKPPHGAGAYGRFINRPMGRRIAAASNVLGLTPNRVTLISAVLSFSGIVLVAFGPRTWWSGVLITVLLVLGYGFDAADGQLARLQGGGSPAGEWLDHSVDMAKMVLFHGAVLVAWLREGTGSWLDPDEPWMLVLLPLGFLLVSVLAFFSWLLVDLLRRVAGREPDRPTGPAPVMRSLLRLPNDYGVFCLVFLLWATPWFLVGYGLLFLANALLLLLALPVWFRQARELSVQD